MGYNELQQKAINDDSSKIVVVAPPGSGKALKNGTKVLTENGWQNIEDIKINDKVYGPNGQLANVIGVYPQGKKQIYKVTFNDGNVIECCEDHLWAYQTTDMHRSKSKNYRVHSTKYLYENVPCTKLDGGYNRKNIYTPMIKPIQFNNNTTLPLRPYLLGALIGGGRCLFTNQDKDVIERVDIELREVGSYLHHKEKYDYFITSGTSSVAGEFRRIIRSLNLEESSYNKSIPEMYLKAPVEDRLQLLQGLIDTDGYVAGSSYEYYTSSEQLAEDVTFLCEGLGFLVTRSIKKASYVDSLGERISCKDCHRLRIKASAEYPKLHWCKRKDSMWRKAQSYAHRCITNIEPTEGYAEMTCISVDNDDHLYVTEHCIVTHNTHSLVGAISKYAEEHPLDHITAITFTRKAASELQFKLHDKPQVDTRTIHSWSLMELNKLASKYNFKVDILTDIQVQEILKFLCRQLNYYSINYFLLTAFIMGNYNIDVSEGEKSRYKKVLATYIDYKRENQLYDFTDLPLYLYDMLMLYDERITNVDALFVDEFQDVDATQAVIFTMVDAKKHFYIGDPHQCQPAGTKVYVRGEGEKNIEDIKIGDAMVFYDSDQGYCSGLKLPHNAKRKVVTNISSRDFVDDYLITVYTEEGRKSSYTPNHRTFVKLNDLEDKHVVYLMCDDNYRFRVGKIPLNRNKNVKDTSNPWRKKMKDEGCSKIWLLKYFDTDKEARLEEARISYKYGIPQTCFQTQKVLWTKEDIDYIYEGIDIFDRANQCLKDYKLNINYPLLDTKIEWLNKNHYTTNSYVQIYSSNLMEDYMTCMAWGSESSHKNHHPDKIVKVEKTFITEPIKVYSLEVEGGAYMADGLMTHNSIYIFRGAESSIINNLKDQGFKTLKLEENYRSYQSIMDFSTQIVDGDVELCEEITSLKPSWVRCVRQEEPGEVYTINQDGKAFDLVKQQRVEAYKLVRYFMEKKPFILCRSNKWVKAIQSLGYKNVSTIHQAKGLEYPNVIYTDTPLSSEEETNIAYVACTRARDGLMVVNFSIFMEILQELIQEDEAIIATRSLF